MPEFLNLLPPDEARRLLLSHLPDRVLEFESIDVFSSLDRILSEDILAPHPLPEFRRSTVDGYAVRAQDTFGAADTLPAYLSLAGEVPMGDAPSFRLASGQCGLIHTGGMLPDGSDAVVMLEHTQHANSQELEVLRAVAEGENVIRVGEDVAAGQMILPKGSRMRPAEMGGLLALGILFIPVVRAAKVGILSTGDEIVEPQRIPRSGQVRDINSYTLEALVKKIGGAGTRYGIIPDQFEALRDAASKSLSDNDLVIITAGSSASTRDMTAEVIDALGKPGVLVHGINTRPGKPTILGVCDGKPVIGLPGNPVSALVNGYLFVEPAIEKLSGVLPKPKPRLRARLRVNLSSQAGREDWWPVRLIENLESPTDQYDAEPIFGKSNLIFNLAHADGLLRIPPNATGLSAGEAVEVFLL